MALLIKEDGTQREITLVSISQLHKLLDSFSLLSLKLVNSKYQYMYVDQFAFKKHKQPNDRASMIFKINKGTYTIFGDVVLVTDKEDEQ